ncbi:hypothetical protein WG66_009891 [Moniliophthora roreri]|nr:hypothetical protein WG66_009891 [Moniliophthora roreri]
MVLVTFWFAVSCSLLRTGVVVVTARMMVMRILRLPKKGNKY